MKKCWFKKFGWMYLPTHFMGMLISLLAIAFVVLVCMVIIKNRQSVSDDTYEDDLYEFSFILPALLCNENGLPKNI